MSDLLQLGAHCAVPSCNVNDFLPITCKCDAVFCRDHITPELHSCSAVHQYEPGESGFTKLQRCDVESCTKPSLFAFTTDPDRETCDKCRKAFCVDHRYPDTHACIPVKPENAEASSSSSSARALLQKHFGSNLSSPSSSSQTAAKAKPVLPKKKLPTDPAKLAQYRKVQLMKMRHSAVPVDPKDKVSLPAEQRLTVNVAYEQVEKAFWIRKTISTGKAIDLLASQFKATSSSPIQLLNLGPNEETTILKNDQPLADQVEDGATILLKKAEPTT